MSTHPSLCPVPVRPPQGSPISHQGPPDQTWPCSSSSSPCHRASCSLSRACILCSWKRKQQRLPHSSRSPAWVHCVVTEREPRLATEDLGDKGKQRGRLMSPENRLAMSGAGVGGGPSPRSSCWTNTHSGRSSGPLGHGGLSPGVAAELCRGRAPGATYQDYSSPRL